VDALVNNFGAAFGPAWLTVAKLMG
jgi:hypothetical protein